MTSALSTKRFWPAFSHANSFEGVCFRSGSYCETVLAGNSGENERREAQEVSPAWPGALFMQTGLCVTKDCDWYITLLHNSGEYLIGSLPGTKWSDIFIFRWEQQHNKLSVLRVYSNSIVRQDAGSIRSECGANYSCFMCTCAVKGIPFHASFQVLIVGLFTKTVAADIFVTLHGHMCHCMTIKHARRTV